MAQADQVKALTAIEEQTEASEVRCMAGYNLKALSCTPTYLDPPISQFLHKTFITFYGVTLKFGEMGGSDM